MRGNSLKIFYKSSVIRNLMPVNFKETDSELFKNDKEIKLPQSELFILKNVFVTDLGIIYKDLSSLKENIICYDADFKNYRLRYFLRAFLKFKKLKYSGKRAIIIFDNYSGPNGFAHWICDGLTRLAEMNDSLAEYSIVVPAYFKEQKIYTESLKLFNISETHYLHENSLTFFKELAFPTPIGETGNFHPENVKKLRNIVRAKIQLPEVPTKNIYISREKAKRRFVKNEKDVVHLLKNYNFEIVYLEEYSFEEQINLLNSATNIVSIHGAALSMLLFVGENTSVMELRGKGDAINNMYFLLANVCRLNYYYLTCESIEKSKTGNDFDLMVDLHELEKNIDLMISKKPEA